MFIHIFENKFVWFGMSSSTVIIQIDYSGKIQISITILYDMKVSGTHNDIEISHRGVNFIYLYIFKKNHCSSSIEASSFTLPEKEA